MLPHEHFLQVNVFLQSEAFKLPAPIQNTGGQLFYERKDDRIEKKTKITLNSRSTFARFVVVVYDVENVLKIV